MRLRRNKRIIDDRNSGGVSDLPETADGTMEAQEKNEVKLAKPVKANNPMRFVRKILDNPNFSFQLMVIILTLASDNVQMDRRIEGMTTTVDKVRNIADVINNTMNSVKAAAEAPKTIRRLLE